MHRLLSSTTTVVDSVHLAKEGCSFATIAGTSIPLFGVDTNNNSSETASYPLWRTTSTVTTTTPTTQPFFATATNPTNHWTVFGENEAYIRYYWYKRKPRNEKSVKSDLSFLRNDQKTVKKQGRRRPAYRPNKGQRRLNRLFLVKSDCIGVFLLLRLIGFSVCLGENNLLAAENDKKQPRTPQKH